MSFEAAAWAIKQCPKLPTEKLTLIALADCHNRDSGRCDPSLLTLASVAMCSDRTAMRSVESLEKQGFILTEKVTGKRTRYQLIFNKTPDTHVTPAKLSPLTPCLDTPDTHVTTPLTPMSPEPVSTKKKPLNKYTEGDLSLAEWIYELILVTAPKTKKPNLEKWADTFRLMRECDDLTRREIAEVFKWANSDPFWSTNVLSAEKLRKQFSVLHAHFIKSINRPLKNITDDQLESAFNFFWELYPKKEGDIAAKDALKKVVSNQTQEGLEIVINKICDRVGDLMKSDWLERESTYIPLAANFINATEWLPQGEMQ